MNKAESQIKQIPYPVEAVYARLSDFRNIEQAKEQLKNDPLIAEKLQENGMKFNPDDIQCTEDTIFTSVPNFGEVGLQIVEREENRMLKCSVVGVPITFNLWLQVLPNGDSASKMKLTLGYDIPVIVKAMLSGKLKQIESGLDKFADIIANIKYE